jgi:hypothetical protein
MDIREVLLIIAFILRILAFCIFAFYLIPRQYKEWQSRRDNFRDNSRRLFIVQALKAVLIAMTLPQLFDIALNPPYAISPYPAIAVSVIFLIISIEWVKQYPRNK